MNWYQENRWLGNFLLGLGLAILASLWFLWHANGSFADAMAEFNAAATERSRLEHLTPFPNEDNFHKTQLELENYGVRLDAVKAELRAQALPASPIAPNEFQNRLRQAIVATTERARPNRVKLPENFHLGFDEFASALPGPSEAPLLGQSLAQVELLLGILIDARVDGISNIKRVTASAEPGAANNQPAKKPAGPNQSAPVVERSAIDLTFTASPSALRKVLNQIASSDRQFFIVRTLYVRNEQLKGPTREGTTAAPVSAAPTSPNSLKFIVGNEHLEATATIEMARFAF